MLRRLLTALGIVSSAGSAVAADFEWPPLPTSGFIAGRAATKADISSGNAVFVAEAGGKIIGTPIDIQIPQYARLVDTRVLAIVVQAEAANGIRMFGIRTFDGAEMVATDRDLELLGTRPPQQVR